MKNKTVKQIKIKSKSPKVRVQVMLPLHVLSRIQILIEQEKTSFNDMLQNLIITAIKIRETALKLEDKKDKDN